MKIKILTFIANFILGKVIKDDEPRADMFLPMWLLAFSLVLSIIGCTLVIVSIFKFSLWAVIGAALAIVLGIAALLCWRNQSIVIISDETFVYTTFLGNKKTYYFNDITGFGYRHVELKEDELESLAENGYGILAGEFRIQEYNREYIID